MSMEVSIFCRGKLGILNEYPENGYQLALGTNQDRQITLFLDSHEQWWQLRQSLPKLRDGYVFHRRHGDSITDHATADEAAHAYHVAHEESISLAVALEAIGEAAE